MISLIAMLETTGLSSLLAKMKLSAPRSSRDSKLSHERRSNDGLEIGAEFDS